MVRLSPTTLPARSSGSSIFELWMLPVPSIRHLTTKSASERCSCCTPPGRGRTRTLRRRCRRSTSSPQRRLDGCSGTHFRFSDRSSTGTRSDCPSPSPPSASSCSENPRRSPWLSSRSASTPRLCSCWPAPSCSWRLAVWCSFANERCRCLRRCWRSCRWRSYRWRSSRRRS